MSHPPAQEIVPEVAPHPLVITQTRDGGSGKDGSSDGAEPGAHIAIAPLRRDEPVVTRKVCLLRSGGFVRERCWDADWHGAGTLELLSCVLTYEVCLAGGLTCAMWYASVLQR